MNALAVRVLLPVVAAIALVTPGPLGAQERLSVDGGLFNVQRRVLSTSSPRQQTGMFLGGGGAVRFGPLRIGLDGFMGTLKGDGAAENPDVKMRTSAATVQVQVRPGVLVGGRYEVRRFDATGVVTMWKLMGATARWEPGLGMDGLRAVAEVAVLPVSSVSLGPKLNPALQVTVGASYAPPGSPLTFRLRYRFERYDIAGSGLSGERYEQFRGLVAEAGLRLGR